MNYLLVMGPAALYILIREEILRVAYFKIFAECMNKKRLELQQGIQDVMVKLRG